MSIFRKQSTFMHKKIKDNAKAQIYQI